MKKKQTFHIQVTLHTEGEKPVTEAKVKATVKRLLMVNSLDMALPGANITFVEAIEKSNQ